MYYISFYNIGHSPCIQTTRVAHKLNNINNVLMRKTESLKKFLKIYNAYVRYLECVLLIALPAGQRKTTEAGESAKNSRFPADFLSTSNSSKISTRK